MLSTACGVCSVPHVPYGHTRMVTRVWSGQHRAYGQYSMAYGLYSMAHGQYQTLHSARWSIRELSTARCTVLTQA
eukprot:1956212-Rhodomonas_salina.4